HIPLLIFEIQSGPLPSKREGFHEIFDLFYLRNIRLTSSSAKPGSPVGRKTVRSCIQSPVLSIGGLNFAGARL
ncbi:MAG: hypothetical protein KDD10_10405, partial [Phaeodactylibacter sp.]|nr:hypothetical protein [Phaeodactylibacter sp.]